MNLLRSSLAALLLIFPLWQGRAALTPWLDLCKRQVQLREHGARESVVVDWFIENDRRVGIYWHPAMGVRRD
jgi:hypothetical protein